MKRTVVMLAAVGLAVATAAPPAQAKPPTPPPATVAFSSASYSVSEGAGSVTVTVNRSDSTGKASTVLFSASAEGGDTATAGSDFTPVTDRVLTFKGKRSVSTTVPILNDTVAEPAETFHVTLSAPSSPTTLGSPSTAVVTINDNDVPAVPGNVDATAVPPDTIDVTWDANTDYVTSYEVFRSTTATGTYSSVGTPTTNSFSDTALEPGTYYYEVKARNGVGSSAASEPVSATLQQQTGVQNGGFESGDFTGWTAGAFAPSAPESPLLARLQAPHGTRAVTARRTALQLVVSPPTPVVQSVTVHSGTYAAYLGGKVDDATPTGASYVYQDVAVPASGQDVLRFFYLPQSTGGTLGVSICDSSVPIEQATCEEPTFLTGNAQTWQEGELSLAGHESQTVRVVFAVSQSESTGSASMYLDDVTMPTAGPSNLEATAVAPGAAPPYEIDLSWDTAADATGGYAVLRSTTSGGPYTQVAATATNSYQDTTVNPATFYCYVVRSVTAGGQTASSNQSCAEVVAEKVFNGGFETGDFTGWTAGTWGPGLDAPTLRSRSTTSAPSPTPPQPVAPPTPVVTDETVHSGTYAAYLGGPVNDTTPTGESYVFTDLTVPAAGGVLSFYYRPQTALGAPEPMVQLCAAAPPPRTGGFGDCNAPRNLPYSEIDSWHQGMLNLDGTTFGGQTIRVVFYVDQFPSAGAQMYLDDVTLGAPLTLTAPDAPTNLTANAVSPFEISLSWDASTGATGYDVFRATAAEGPYYYVGSTDATSFADSGLVPDTTYYYEVEAVAGFLNSDTLTSDYSTEAHATTSPVVATLLDSLEGATSGWTTTGTVGDQSQSLWHLVDSSPCADPAYASPTHAFYYGLDSTCNYNATVDQEGVPTPATNSGTLTSPAYTIPAAADAVGFEYLLGTECGGNTCPYDKATVEASYDGGSTWVPLGRLLDTSGTWQRVYLPISPSGTSLQVRFTFDTVDQISNSYLGWMVDDLSVYQEGQTSGTFQNTGTIFIPAAGAAGTYPSTIAVTGLVGTVSDVNVTLNGFTHTAPSDVDVLLVGPTGQTVVLFGDAGMDIDVAGVNLTFDDAASSCVPQSSQIVTGTYKPCAAYDGTSFTSPAPSPPYGTTLGGFNGTDPNGTWKLFVYDDYAGDYGQFAGGWSLSITTS